MLRVLLVLLIILAAALAWRLLRALMQQRTGADGAPKVRMVKCAICDLYLPESEAIRDGDHYYCSAPHRQLGGGENR
jgi:uncharacterized protein